MRHTSRRRSCRPAGEQLESRALLSTYVVVNTQTEGHGSLMWAIKMANQHRGPDTINFNIPGDGEHDILAPDGPVGNIKSKVIIDGYTQPGSARNTSTDPKVNNARITVNIIAHRGSVTGLFVGGDGTQIRGLGFFDTWRGINSGIRVVHAKNVTVDGCFFGKNQPGQFRLNRAIDIRDGNHNTIGGGDNVPALQNVMTNYAIGVEVQGLSQHNAIVGNLIGGEPTQSEDQQVGVFLQNSAKHNTVIRNRLFKNILAVKLTSTNVIEDNDIVDR